MLDSAGHLGDAPSVTVTPVGPAPPWGAAVPREEVAGGGLWTAGRSKQSGSSSIQRLVEAGPRGRPGHGAQILLGSRDPRGVGREGDSIRPEMPSLSASRVSRDLSPHQQVFGEDGLVVLEDLAELLDFILCPRLQKPLELLEGGLRAILGLALVHRLRCQQVDALVTPLHGLRGEKAPWRLFWCLRRPADRCALRPSAGQSMQVLSRSRGLPRDAGLKPGALPRTGRSHTEDKVQGPGWMVASGFLWQVSP